MKKVSLADVAKSLGVSKTLVSLVLNNRGDEHGISKETQKKVYEKVQELNYKPNQFARGLRIGKSNTIGLVVADISNPFYAKLCRSIEDFLNSKGYNLMICSSDENPEKESELIQMLIERHVDGLIISTTQLNNEDIFNLQSRNFPLVLIDRHLPNINTNYVIVDNVAGAENAVQYLIDSGHKHIGYLTITPSYITTIKDRKLGYERALEANKLSVNPDLIKEIDFNSLNEDIEGVINDIITNHPEVTALFVSNNNLAIAALECLKKLKINVPERISLVCFDDIEVFKLCHPPITAVSQPINEMGRVAAKTLLSQVNKESDEIENICFSTELVLRESCQSIG